MTAAPAIDLAKDPTRDLSANLYECDYLRWVDDTVTKLESRNFEQLDLANLIEEIEDLGRSQKKELRQCLATLLAHLLKRVYVNLSQDFNGWQRTIREQRRQIKFELEDSPSLSAIWHKSFDSAWRFALETVREDYTQVEFPDIWQFSRELDPILNLNFWE